MGDFDVGKENKMGENVGKKGENVGEKMSHFSRIALPTSRDYSYKGTYIEKSYGPLFPIFSEMKKLVLRHQSSNRPLVFLEIR